MNKKIKDKKFRVPYVIHTVIKYKLRIPRGLQRYINLTIPQNDNYHSRQIKTNGRLINARS